MQILLFEYKKKKWKLIAYIVGGLILLLVLIIAALTGQLQEESCDNSTTTQTQLDSKDMTTNAKNIYAHWKEKYGATPQAAAGILGVLQLESRLDPNSVNSSSGATGLAQWLGNRKKAVEALAKKENKPVTNLGVQLDYLDQELSSSSYASNKKIFKYTDVHKATKAWLMNFEGMSKNPEQWYLGQRYVYADHWYSVFGSSDPVSSTTLDNASTGSISELGCSSDPSYSGNDIVKTAESMKGWFYYVQSHPSPDLGSDLSKPNKSGGTDCSGFVWLTLNKAGYKVPANMGWYTASMASDATGSHQWFKQISESDAKAGDVVIVNENSGAGNDGHTAILLGKWQGKATKIIEEGGTGGSGGVNESTFGSAFSSLLNGGNITLARPIKSKEKSR